MDTVFFDEILKSVKEGFAIHFYQGPYDSLEIRMSKDFVDANDRVNSQFRINRFDLADLQGDRMRFAAAVLERLRKNIIITKKENSPMSMINIEGLDKAEVLKELYNNSRVQGMGFLQATGRDLSLEEARVLLTKTTYFDYLHGKVMKVDLSSDTEFKGWLYDRDNGEGAAQRVIDSIRERMTKK